MLGNKIHSVGWSRLQVLRYKVHFKFILVTSGIVFRIVVTFSDFWQPRATGAMLLNVPASVDCPVAPISLVHSSQFTDCPVEAVTSVYSLYSFSLVWTVALVWSVQWTQLSLETIWDITTASSSEVLSTTHRDTHAGVLFLCVLSLYTTTPHDFEKKSWSTNKAE